MELRTKRCTIRCFKECDITDFMIYRNNADWMKYQGFKCRTEAEYKDRLLNAHASVEDGMQLAVISNESGRLIGDIYLKKEDNDYWVGYSVNPQYARMGYASEAVSIIIDTAKEHCAAHIMAGTDPGNTASMGLLEKLSFSCTERHPDELIYVLDLTKTNCATRSKQWPQSRIV